MLTRSEELLLYLYQQARRGPTNGFNFLGFRLLVLTFASWCLSDGFMCFTVMSR